MRPLRFSLLVPGFVVLALAGCGGGDDDGGGITAPSGYGGGSKSDFERQSSVNGCIKLWNSAANQPTREEVRTVITYSEPPAVSVDLAGRCNVIAVFEDAKRAYVYAQGEGPDGAPYQPGRKTDIGSLPGKLRRGKLRFAAGDDPQISTGG